MKYINVIYDYEYDNYKEKLTNIGMVDIIIVPDYISDNIDDIVQKFFDWTEDVVFVSNKSKYPEYWGVLPNGKECMSVNSDHFVKWINDNYFNCENQESRVVKIDTVYNSKFSSAMF